MTFESIKPLLDSAFASRHPTADPGHQTAFRLFNGFHEGCPSLVLDVYARTLVIHDYGGQPDPALIKQVAEYARASFGWLNTGIVKTRNGKTQEEKRGQLLFGETPDKKIVEHDIWYALDLTMNRDASFYLDTRHLRKWLMETMRGKTVLNAFAYAGSLGVAAVAGGAERVVQTDLNRRFLDLAKESYTLNGFPIHKRDFIAGDFFPVVARFKSANQTFDCVVIDPPFFSVTPHGKVDLVNESRRIINKIRPLINDGGTLVAINNAVFLSGGDYMRTLEDLCKDGYLGIRELIPVPDDFIGINRVGSPPADPAPFNHSTKIAILDVKRKKVTSEA